VYRPDPWKLAETVTVISGVAALVSCTVVAWSTPAQMLPSTSPLVWPPLVVAPMLGILFSALPAWIAPPVPNPVPARETATPDTSTSRVRVAV
jgi:energy-coupling factor transport system permease protein